MPPNGGIVIIHAPQSDEAGVIGREVGEVRVHARTFLPFGDIFNNLFVRGADL